MPDSTPSAGNSSPGNVSSTAPQSGEDALRDAVAAGARSLANTWTSGATTDTLNSSLLTVVAALLTAGNKIGWQKSVDVLFDLLADNWQFAIVPAVTAAIAFIRKDR